MTTFIEALLKQLQSEFDDTASITIDDLTTIVQTARAEAMQGAKRTRITLEGVPQAVALVTQVLRDVFQIINESPDHPVPEKGFVYRYLMLEGVKLQLRSTGKTSAPPQNTNIQQPKDQVASEESLEIMMDEILTTLARGLLEFPVDDEGRRQFTAAYPEIFKQGITKLSAYLLLHGIVISEAVGYWRILSQPLRQWPNMPAPYQFDDALIDHDGSTTSLAELLAQDESSF